MSTFLIRQRYPWSAVPGVALNGGVLSGHHGTLLFFSKHAILEIRHATLQCADRRRILLALNA